jgi:hypothetical protein
MHTTGLEVDESSLTGVSDTIVKKPYSENAENEEDKPKN